ncbi:MAG: hypothetical protein QOI48_1259, partial [Solirubrobacteraceae bacterium]|nr:hypothetical protein [Solirubrobacteraceae bacterium]
MYSRSHESAACSISDRWDAPPAQRWRAEAAHDGVVCSRVRVSPDDLIAVCLRFFGVRAGRHRLDFPTRPPAFVAGGSTPRRTSFWPTAHGRRRAATTSSSCSGTPGGAEWTKSSVRSSRVGWCCEQSSMGCAGHAIGATRFSLPRSASSRSPSGTADRDLAVLDEGAYERWGRLTNRGKTAKQSHPSTRVRVRQQIMSLDWEGLCRPAGILRCGRRNRASDTLRGAGTVSRR